jgi:hypothetical protein
MRSLWLSCLHKPNNSTWGAPGGGGTETYNKISLGIDGALLIFLSENLPHQSVRFASFNGNQRENSRCEVIKFEKGTGLLIPKCCLVRSVRDVCSLSKGFRFFRG